MPSGSGSTVAVVTRGPTSAARIRPRRMASAMHGWFAGKPIAQSSRLLAGGKGQPVAPLALTRRDRVEGCRGGRYGRDRLPRTTALRAVPEGEAAADFGSAAARAGAGEERARVVVQDEHVRDFAG